MKELNKTSVDVKEESNEMPTSEPNQKQIIDGLAQRVITLDKANAQLSTEISNLENKLIEKELMIEKTKASYDKKYCECEELKGKLEIAEETIKKLSEANDELQDKLEHLDEINKELVDLLGDGEDKGVKVECRLDIPVKEVERYPDSWDKKITELNSHLEGEKTYYENQIKELKHELIEFPQREAILNKKLKYNTQCLKHINRIIKAVLK